MFTGRVVLPGEPEFLPVDVDLALALAEEERDTCPSCGLLKSICRDPANQFAFDAADTVCWATYRMNLYQRSDKVAKRNDATRGATQVFARFRKGHEPDLLVGLDLAPDEDD